MTERVLDAARRAAMREIVETANRHQQMPNTMALNYYTDVPDLLTALERAEAENARLREALAGLTEEAASYVADYPTWNVVWRGGSTKGMIAAVARARAALGEAAPAQEATDAPGH